jgi:cytidylate kinase
MRDIARRGRIDVTELARRAEADPSINARVDERTIELSHHERSFVMDGRMAWWFIPSSFKVLLVVTEKEAARRLRLREPRRLKSVSAALGEVRSRSRCERAQYRAQYGVDFLARDHYDIVVDTTKLAPDEVVKLILRAVVR